MSGVDWFQKRGNVSQMVSAAFAVVSAIIAAVGFCLVLQQLKDSRSKTAAEAYRAELADARKI